MHYEEFETNRVFMYKDSFIGLTNACAGSLSVGRYEVVSLHTFGATKIRFI